MRAWPRFNGRHIVSSMEKIVRLTSGVGRNDRIFSQPSALDARCFDIRPEDLFARVRCSIYERLKPRATLRITPLLNKTMVMDGTAIQHRSSEKVVCFMLWRLMLHGFIFRVQREGATSSSLLTFSMIT